jgi:hypothetical protein
LKNKRNWLLKRVIKISVSKIFSRISFDFQSYRLPVDSRLLKYMQAFYDLGGEDPVTGMVAPSARVKVIDEPVAKPALCSGRFLF